MNITERARQYMEMYENTLRPTDVPETPEAAIELAGKFDVPDNTQFYRDRLEGLAAKRAEALKDNRWLALAQFGAGIADGRPNSFGPAASSGLAALRSANMEDKAGEAAELESRLKLAGMDQARTAAQMNNAREMYTSGLASRAAAKQKALGLGIDMAQSDRSNALGYAQLSQGDLSRKFYDLMKIPGMTEAQAKAIVSGTGRGQSDTSISTMMNYLNKFDAGVAKGDRYSKEAKETAELFRSIIRSGQIPDNGKNTMIPNLLPNADSQINLPIPSNTKPTAATNSAETPRPSDVAQQALGLPQTPAEAANRGDVIISKAGGYEQARAQIARMDRPKGEKAMLYSMVEAARVRRTAMAGTRGQ